MIHPDAVTSCNVDLESLISDNNRSIATLAITTLLKVCGWGEGEGGEREGGGGEGANHAPNALLTSLRRGMRQVLSV